MRRQSIVPFFIQCNKPLWYRANTCKMHLFYLLSLVFEADKKLKRSKKRARGDQKGIIWHACKCYCFPILLVPHFFYQYSFSSRHSRHKFRQRGFINKKIKTCDWLKCLQSPDICQICPENFWRYVPNVSRPSSNVLRHLSNVSDTCQIFPTAHLRPDFQSF